jgi:hypothetical protein
LANVGTWWSRWKRWTAQHLGGRTKVAEVAAYGKKKYKENKEKKNKKKKKIGGGPLRMVLLKIK